MNIDFIKFTKKYLPLYYKWAKKEHVKEIWFRPGYSPKEAIIKKIEGNGYEFPFIFTIDNKNVGYIKYYDLAKFNPPDSLKNEPTGTLGFDLFIGEEEFLGKGYGTEVVKEFSNKLLAPEGVNRIILDPFADNKRAIRCYEKAGFTFVRTAKDDMGTEFYIMELKK